MISRSTIQRLKKKALKAKGMASVELSLDQFKAMLPITLDDWQADLLTNHHRVLVAAGRQVGKSSAAALLAIWKAVEWPSRTVLILSPSLRQSQELHRKVRSYCREMAVGKGTDSRIETQFSNRSRVVALPCSPDTIRGYSADLCILDESAFLPEEVEGVITPMLASTDGGLILVSSPMGRRGWFYRLWSEGGDHWTRLHRPTSSCPRVSAEFLAEQKATLPPIVFQSEFEAQFVENVNQPFPISLIENALWDPRKDTKHVEGHTDGPTKHHQARGILATIKRASVQAIG